MLGSLTLPDGGVGFDAEGTAMVPITAGKNKVGTIELKSPLEMFKETFTSMKESLLNMVGLQTQAQKDAAFITSGMQGPIKPNDDLEGVDTDDNTYGNFVEKAESTGDKMLEGIKDAFNNVSFGEKMTAILLVGGLIFFTKYKDKLVKVLTPIVQFVMDMVDTFGPGKVFAAFIGGFLLLKSGLAKKAILFAGQNILKGIKASAAAIDKQGGLVKAVGNGFEKINRGMGSVVAGAKKAGGMITGGLTKGFSMLGRGLTALRLGVMSMYSSIMPMIAPFLPIIAIAAAVVAVLYSLKSGFDVFKQALDDGDSMLVAIGKGVMDAMMTLVLLPVTLIKKLVGFVAGLLGFDNFKESLEGFSIKDKIVGAFKSLTGGMFKIVKAIAKGVVAALAAALPGGKTPQEEFARAYQEVMKGGEGKSEIETQKMKGGEETGDANVAESFYANNVPKFAMKKMNRTDLMNQDNDILNEFKTDKMGNPLKLLPGESMTSTTMKTETIKKEGKVVSSKQDVVVVKGGDVKQGDTINQMSQTTIGGDLEVNNQERTQRSIQEMF